MEKEEKKKLPMISVQTLPNGYSLAFDGMSAKGGFMYFSPEKLLEGFMVHIGLEMTDQLNTETIQDFLVTAINWRDNKACVKEIERLTAALKTVSGRRAVLARQMIAERNRYNDLLDELKSLRKTLKSHPDGSLVKSVDKVIKGYKTMPVLTLKSLGVSEDEIAENDEEEKEEDND